MPEALHSLAKGLCNPAQTLRLLALPVVSAGALSSSTSENSGVGLHTLGDWGLDFNANGPNGLTNGKPLGARSHLNADQHNVHDALLEHGPTPHRRAVRSAHNEGRALCGSQREGKWAVPFDEGVGLTAGFDVRP